LQQAQQETLKPLNPEVLKPKDGTHSFGGAFLSNSNSTAGFILPPTVFLALFFECYPWSDEHHTSYQ
jgi:hypothetical protein